MTKQKNIFAVISIILLFFSVTFADTAHAASFSGIVYQDNGITPITGESVTVYIYKGIPCCTAQYVQMVSSNSITGIYTVTGLDAGTYYLKASSNSDSNYLSEWWAIGSSVMHCNDSESITVAAGDSVVGINFQLDSGATIAGHVYQADGATPIVYNTYNEISVYTDDSCDNSRSVSFTGGKIKADGSYTVGGLKAGTYYLQTAIDRDVNYLDEWWAGAASSRDCSQAQIVTVADGQAISGKNFQLSPGAVISGSVYESDGTTPVTDINVRVYTGDPCGDRQRNKSVYPSWGTNIYSVVGLATGTYYLQANPSSEDNYLEEWWAGSASTRDCGQAQAITVVEGTTYNAKNFQLDSGATISGTLFENDGTTPASGFFSVNVYSGDPCGEKQSIAYYSGWSGNPYSIVGIEAGSYYLQASSYDNYLEEWWAGSTSSRNCSQAQIITVTDGQAISGKDFQLDPGAAISGTIYHSDGSTPLKTGAYIHLIKGDPCNAPEDVASGWVSWDGSYIFAGLPSGKYFINTEGSGNGNYITEWWAGSASVRACSQAQPIDVTTGNTYPGNNFQLDSGAVICGTFYHSNGTTPITDEQVNILLYNSDPCTSTYENRYMWGSTDSSTGTFAFFGLPDDEYYIHTASGGQTNYIAEWWNSPASVRSCSQAQSSTTTEGNIYTGKNFQLEPGATISGTVFEQDGITLAKVSHEGGIIVEAYSGNPCKSNNQPVSYGRHSDWKGNADNSYTIQGMPPGPYYLLAKNSPDKSQEKSYKDEWWAASASKLSCSLAQPVTVTGLENITGKNFYLDPFISTSSWILYIPAITGNEKHP